ncbi:hypothetical protein FACS18949_03010 [Clostridia bacterium]|nr:hypothetical protein FACS18949_03010 [Clostridia bacterium]
MKKILAIAISAVLCFALSSCGVTVDLDTPKSSELKAQYDFYSDSMNKLRSDMGITPEQADEVFIALVSIGLDSKVTNVLKKYSTESTYDVSWSGAISKEVDIVNGAVSEIRNGVDVLYPLERSTKILNRAAVENVTALIEGLTAESSREDYEAAQSAYDALSKSLKKEISEALVKKLSAENSSTQTLEVLCESVIKSVGVDVSSVDIFDEGNTGAEGDRRITINANASDSWTVSLIRSGILSSSSKVLKELQPRSDISQVCFLWSFPLVDSFGNTSNDVVVKILLYKETIDKINFDSFDWNQFSNIADDFYLNPALSD